MAKITFAQKWRWGSIIGHRIDYNGAEAYTQQKLTQIPPRDMNLSHDF